MGAPFGFWDPMGLCKDGDVTSFKRRRETEIKHGRVSMFACLGYMVPEYYKLPGFLAPSSSLKFADVPNGLAAIGKVPVEGWLQMTALGGFYELCVNVPTDEPGNFGKGFLGITGKSIEDPSKRSRSLNAEIANGRLAMAAIMGMMFQNGVTGTTGPEMWGPGGAFETELGVQAPTGFWDPAGFCKDGNAANFGRRRATEIKHGRISMLACMGYMTPELGLRLPGFLSPSTGLKFTDVPNGLAAISKVPSAGWAQIAAYMAYCEVSQKQAPGTPAYEGNFGFKAIPDSPVYDSSDPAQRRRRLNAELANGRLAMMAIIGIFFQDGLTGSPWGDWDLYTESSLRAFQNTLVPTHV